MLKKKKTLFIMGLILIVGCGAFFAYRYQKEVSSTVKIQEYVGPVFDLEEIVSIEYIAGETIKLNKDNGIWQNPESAYLKYDQVLIKEWTEALHDIQTKEIIKNVQDETLYGINESSIKMTLCDAKGQEQTIQIGDMIEAEDSIYLKASENIFVISYGAVKDLLISPNHFVDCSKVLQIPEIEKLNILYKDKKEIQMSKPNGWILEDYYELTGLLDEEVMNDLVNTLSESKITNYVGTYKALEKYGLDSPQLELTLNENLKIAFGKQSDDEVYVTINEGLDVYSMEKSVYKKLVDFNAYDAMNKQVLHLNQNEISEVILSNPQGTYHFFLNLEIAQIEENEGTKTEEELNQNDTTQLEQEEAEKNEQPNAENNLGETPDNHLPTEMIVAKINDRVLTKEEADEWFDKIQQSLWIEAPLQNPTIEQKEERKAEAQMSYVLKDGSKIDIELIPYDINYYILRYNGVIEFAVNKERITKVFNELTNLTK